MHSQGSESRRAMRGQLDLGMSGTEVRTPRVTRTFAIYMGLALVFAAASILYFVGRNVESSSRQKVSDHAEFVAATVVPRLIGSDAWNSNLTEAQLGALDAATSTDLLGRGVIAAKFYSPEGMVIYSTDRSEIGKSVSQTAHASNRAPSSVSGGTSKRQITAPDGTKTTAIEASAPVKYPDQQRQAGTLVLLSDYGAAADTVRNQALPLAAFVLLIFILLYAALLPILRSTTRQLRYSNIELRRRAEDLNENLIKRAQIEQQLRETIADLERSEHALTLSQEETIMRLSIAVETRDQETGDHIERMGRYCALLAQMSGWDENSCELLRIAAPLHDVGKIAIPDAILLKPGALTEDEREQMQKHAEIGHEILSGSDSPLLDLAARIALTHHEHWDGTGYPNGLAGTDIPIEGRMAAIADVFDALTSDRVYRPAMTVERSLAIMSEGRGSHFDPELLDVFFDSIVEVLLIRDGHALEPREKAEQRPAKRPRRRREPNTEISTPYLQDEDDQRRSLVG